MEREQILEQEASTTLLTKAEGTLDVEQRRSIMAEIETLMQEEGPIAQPLWRAVAQPFHKSVKGHAVHPTQLLLRRGVVAGRVSVT